MYVINIKRLRMVLDNKVGHLAGAQMDSAPTVENAWLQTRGDKIEAYGEMKDFRPSDSGEEIYDAAGGDVMPTFCDSHTHIIYAGSRDGEFLDKIRGLSYEEIAARGGGILNSADRLHDTTEDELYRQSMERARNDVERHRRIRSEKRLRTDC